jgi:hypothetical protein
LKIERQLQGTLVTIFTELIKEKGLDGRLQPYPALEENRADITLKNKNGKTIFFIELKDPSAKDGRSVFDSNVVLRELGRAQKNDIAYFGNCNFLACAFFDIKDINEKVSVNEGFFTLSDISRLGQSYIPNKEIVTKLRSIAEFYIDRAIEILDKKAIKYSNLDELFIFKIRKLIEVYAPPICQEVFNKYTTDKSFKKEIFAYSQSQLWNVPQTFEEIENLTHIGVLMLISKLIFYKTYVDNQTYHNLHPMKVGDDVSTSTELEKLIWKYFDEFQIITGNFELLIGDRAEIIFQIPFVSDSVIDLVKEVLDTEGHYNFSKIPYDIIGRIFEELIREDERHKLGQYFTPPHIIDLINSFAINRFDDKVFDPSCGSGTFLVRAYERKKQLCMEEQRGVKHETLLNEIYGNDLSGYPAYLSMLNLAIRNMSKASYPRIVNKDFFSITNRTKIKLHDQNGQLENKLLPMFDAIVGNPPYTRQEDIGSMRGKVLKTVSKSEISNLIKAECGFEPSQRTSIYAYFFYHASVFLKEGGYLAYICQNSWLDTDYGIDMQRYLMRNYEIVAIMDSEVERFFPTASVNTTIVIVRKQSDEDKRNNNTVKFVYFNKTLSEIIKNYKGVNKLHDFIDDVIISESNEFLHINCIQQDILSISTKWGQFLKAPQVYFDILEKGKDKFVPLSTIAKVKYGIKTGCNEYFILEDKTATARDEILKAAMNNTENITTIKQLKENKLKLMLNGLNELWLLEAECLEPILTSPKDVNSYVISSNKKIPNKFVLTQKTKKSIRNEMPYLFSYIRHGERLNIHQRSTCKSRTIWYDLGEREKPMLSFSYMINDFGKTFKGKIYANDNFQTLYTQKPNTVWYYMNSSISWLIQQITIRTNFGDGVGKIQSYELAAFPFPDIDLENLEIDLGETKNFKEELGTLESLKTVNPERVKLDTAILMALGYKNKKEREEVLLELYKATYKLIDERLKKAQSLKGVKAQRNKVEFSVYTEQLKEMLVEGNIEAKNTFKFAKELEKLVKEISSESKLQKKILDSYWKEKFGELFNEKEIAKKEQGRLFE